MAVIENKYVSSEDGFKKGIEEDSMGMALDILQRGLYAFPVQSTIRELASNSYDAIKERDVARAIIQGTEKVEDHFDVTKEGDIYKSSGWDPNYFDLKWLSNDKNVYLYYEEGSQKDTLRIVDNGVGLGGKRIRGYFQLNYSSKRANKDALGKWGLGSKVALSLGVDSFRVINRYNGKKFKFDVYLDKVESIIPKFGKNGVNNHIVLQEAEEGRKEVIAHYEETDELNGLELQISVKKHNKDRFFTAVEEQLMYMPNIKFMHKERDAFDYREVEIAAKVAYRDKHAIISESTVYNRPHILLGAGDALINYGYVAFAELELEPKSGAVGLIMDINDVEVTPSREALVWSAKTREAVLKLYNNVTKTACDYVNKSLATEKDYIEWLVKANSTMNAIKHGGDNNSVLGKLASIIDISDIKDIRYPKNALIDFKADVDDAMGSEVTARLVTYDRYTKKIERKKIDSLDTLNKPIYITYERADKDKDLCLHHQNGGPFVLLTMKSSWSISERAQYIANSGRTIDYDKYEVDENILDLYDTQDIDENDTAAKVDMAKVRKQNAQIVVHSIQSDVQTFSADTRYITDLHTMYNSTDKIIYGASSARDSIVELMTMFPSSMHLNGPSYASYNGDYTSLHAVLIAKENLKHVKGSKKYVTPAEFVLKSYDEATGKLSFSDEIKMSITYYAIDKYLTDNFGNYKYVNMFSEGNMKNVDKEAHEMADWLKNSWKSYDVGPKRRRSQKAFWDTCVRYQLIKSGTMPGSEEELEDLLNEIDNLLPDYLCELVDDVRDLDILDVDLFKDVIALFMRYNKVRSVLSLYCNKYYYNDKERDEAANLLLKLTKIENDESV